LLAVAWTAVEVAAYVTGSAVATARDVVNAVGRVGGIAVGIWIVRWFRQRPGDSNRPPSLTLGTRLGGAGSHHRRDWAMTDENETPDEQTSTAVEGRKEPESRWAKLDELDPPPEQPDDDRLKGLPVPTMFG